MAIKLLLVEDNEFVQRMYGRSFQAAELEVITANDGAIAVELAKAQAPNIIVMDVMMPNMNGMEALQILKQDDQTKHIPIIMLSAHDDETLLKQALDLGAARYLLKSTLEPDMLIPLVKELVGAAADTPSSTPPSDTTATAA